MNAEVQENLRSSIDIPVKPQNPSVIMSKLDRAFSSGLHPYTLWGALFQDSEDNNGLAQY